MNDPFPERLIYASAQSLSAAAILRARALEEEILFSTAYDCWSVGNVPAGDDERRYLKRPPFGPNFQAAAKRTADLAPTAVQR